MRCTLDAAFEFNILMKYSMVQNQIKKIKYPLKREGVSNRLREDTKPETSYDRALRSNHRTVRRTLFQSILDYWYFRGEVHSEIRGQLISIQMLKRSLISFFEYNLEFFLCIQTTYLRLYNTHTLCYKGQKIAKVCFSTLQGMRGEVSFICFWKRWPETNQKKKSFES